MHIAANTTPYLSEPFVATDSNGAKRCVVVVKGTFAVQEDGHCVVAETQEPLVFADEHYGDPETTAIRYECDFAPVKRFADVLVRGHAVAPQGQAVTSLEVTVVGPGLRKHAIVHGDRTWARTMTGVKPSPPSPFTEIPLTWDRAFGGSDLTDARPSRHGSELRNLVGVGFHLNGDPDVLAEKRLPNIERPGALVTSWSDKPEPIGFGPVGRSWKPRVGFAGTYDESWLAERFPRLPGDFDERYFQAAPLDQQVPQLTGGAAFGCASMNRRGQFVARLPYFVVPVHFVFHEKTHTSMLAVDTLVLEPDRERILMVGRVGVALPRKLTALREIRVGQGPRPSWSAGASGPGLETAVG